MVPDDLGLGTLAASSSQWRLNLGRFHEIQDGHTHILWDFDAAILDLVRFYEIQDGGSWCGEEQIGGHLGTGGTLVNVLWCPKIVVSRVETAVHL